MIELGYVQMLVELVGGYVFLFIIVKVLGKTQISQITPFDFISALVLGEFVGSAVFDPEINLLKILFGITVWGLLIYITEFTTQKSLRLRLFLEGKPSFIIHEGKLDWKELKRNHLDINQLQQLLRSKDVFSLRDVEYAILEPNGSISILKKQEADKPTYKDLNLKISKRMVPLTIISDGEVIMEHLEESGMDYKGLIKRLNEKNISSVKEVAYAEWESDKDLFLQVY
ncbi:Protein of uncharacterised function (DUF421) [Mycobacteroides abscessus subsp. abscessus]|nr:Protein of uncharacterised function (DUF421) [Mycobacteroides abscessus subsp. abscessus]